MIRLIHEINKEAYRIEVWEMYLVVWKNSLSLKTTPALILRKLYFTFFAHGAPLETVLFCYTILNFAHSWQGNNKINKGSFSLDVFKSDNANKNDSLLVNIFNIVTRA